MSGRTDGRPVLRNGPTPVLLWRAAERLGIAPSVADAAQAEGLLTIGERVTFHHPLAR